MLQIFKLFLRKALSFSTTAGCCICEQPSKIKLMWSVLGCLFLATEYYIVQQVLLEHGCYNLH